MPTLDASANDSLCGGVSCRQDSEFVESLKPSDNGLTKTENEYQKAASLLFGGELYVKLLEYSGPEGIMLLRDDRQWRSAMDSLPAEDLHTLDLPVVPRPQSDVDLFLLRSFLTDPVMSKHTGERCGWKLNDLATMILTSSPLTSDQMLQSLVYPGCSQKVMSHILVDENKHLSSSLLQKMIVLGCPPKLFRRIATQQNATSEILSAILLRLSIPRPPGSRNLDESILFAVASHRNTNWMDLQHLSAHKSGEVRKGVAKNTNAARFGLLHALSKDTCIKVRAACASNTSISKEMLIELSMDSEREVRSAVARNEVADKDVLMMLASFYTNDDKGGPLWSVTYNKNCSIDEIFSISNKNHREVLASASRNSALLRIMLGMDGGSYDYSLASNSSVPIDILQVLANSADENIRAEVARNESICASAALIEQLMEDQDESVRNGLANNESIPVHVLELLSKDADVSVRESVVYNARTPFEILKRMLTKDGQTDKVWSWIDGACRYDDIPFNILLKRARNNEEEITEDFATALLEHKDSAKLLSETLAAVENSPNMSPQCKLLEFCLPVGDIIRLYRDPALEKKKANESIRENPLLQTAVDKLFRLYFQSKDGVGSDSHFAQGEQWW